jgi:hypothetical protein
MFFVVSSHGKSQTKFSFCSLRINGAWPGPWPGFWVDPGSALQRWGNWRQGCHLPSVYIKICWSGIRANSALPGFAHAWLRAWCICSVRVNFISETDLHYECLAFHNRSRRVEFRRRRVHSLLLLLTGTIVIVIRTKEMQTQHWSLHNVYTATVDVCRICRANQKFYYALHIQACFPNTKQYSAVQNTYARTQTQTHPGKHSCSGSLLSYSWRLMISLCQTCWPTFLHGYRVTTAWMIQNIVSRVAHIKKPQGIIFHVRGIAFIASVRRCARSKGKRRSETAKDL